MISDKGNLAVAQIFDRMIELERQAALSMLVINAIVLHNSGKMELPAVMYEKALDYVTVFTEDAENKMMLLTSISKADIAQQNQE